MKRNERKENFSEQISFSRNSCKRVLVKITKRNFRYNQIIGGTEGRNRIGRVCVENGRSWEGQGGEGWVGEEMGRAN